MSARATPYSGFAEPITVNITHLRKQAKNFKSIYPEIVAAHGTGISLSAAQDVIARTHGFPSWTAAIKKSTAEAAAAPKSIALASHDAIDCISSGYEFVLEDETELAIRLDHDGEPTAYATGRQAVLCIRSRRDQAKVDREDRAMDALEERVGGYSGSYSEYSPADLSMLLDQAREAVTRCRLYLDGWNRIAGSLWTQKKFREGLAVAEPIVLTLLELLPTQGLIQVCYGQLQNRPFFRLAHCYLLLLHALERHREANALARRMLQLWPNDNIGFRFLLTRADRDAES